MTNETKQATALSEYDFIVVVDKSGSMGETDMPGDKSRWAYMQETATAFCREIESIDSDGLGLVFFGGASIVKQDGVTTANIKDVFAQHRPSGSTPLAQALSEALSLAGKSDKKDFIMVFTDGEPDDKQAVVKVLTDASNAIERDEDLTFLFVQVGREPGATQFLRILDDDMKGAKFDIVDIKTMDEASRFPSTADMVLAAIND